MVGAVLSFAALIFCLDAISKIQGGASSIFIAVLISLLSFALTICIAIFLNQRLTIFKNIFENANDAIAIIDSKGKYIWQNRANKNLCDFDIKKLSSKAPSFFVDNKKLSLIDELNKISEFSGIFGIESKECTPKKVWISAFKVIDEINNTVCYVEMKRNISEFLKLLEQTNAEKERLEKKAKRDFLTGVYNRDGFLSKIDEKIDGSIVFVDIDKFKEINDTFGHEIGDSILKSVAHTLSNGLRSSDVVCRWGGEEFVIWIDATDEAAFQICEKIREKIELSKPNGILITCSFGIAPLEHGLQESIKNADSAMYQAKQSGRNSVKIFENKNQNY